MIIRTQLTKSDILIEVTKTFSIWPVFYYIVSSCMVLARERCLLVVIDDVLVP